MGLVPWGGFLSLVRNMGLLGLQGKGQRVASLGRAVRPLYMLRISRFGAKNPGDARVYNFKLKGRDVDNRGDRKLWTLLAALSFAAAVSACASDAAQNAHYRDVAEIPAKPVAPTDAAARAKLTAALEGDRAAAKEAGANLESEAAKQPPLPTPSSSSPKP